PIARTTHHSVYVAHPTFHISVSILPLPPSSTLFPTRRSSDLSLRSCAVRRPHRAAPGGGSPLLLLRRDRRFRRGAPPPLRGEHGDRKSTRLNSSHQIISYAVFCLKKKT